jgi:hypothetical protein
LRDRPAPSKDYETLGHFNVYSDLLDASRFALERERENPIAQINEDTTSQMKTSGLRVVFSVRDQSGPRAVGQIHSISAFVFFESSTNLPPV